MPHHPVCRIIIDILETYIRLDQIRKLADREEVDYQFLLFALKDYTHPRDKISAWLKSGDLIRVKKGLYVFGEQIAQTPYSLPVLANLIYGPSAISLSYALSFYGLIPERVTTITSITNKRNKIFTTPVGEFTYQYLNTAKYSTEIELTTTSNNKHFLIASPEKALCDYIHIVDKSMLFSTLTDIEKYLFNDLRIDESALQKFKLATLKHINVAYNDPRLLLLLDFIKKWKSI